MQWEELLLCCASQEQCKDVYYSPPQPQKVRFQILLLPWAVPNFHGIWLLVPKILCWKVQKRIANPTFVATCCSGSNNLCMQNIAYTLSFNPVLASWGAHNFSKNNCRINILLSRLPPCALLLHLDELLYYFANAHQKTLLAWCKTLTMLPKLILTWFRIQICSAWGLENQVLFFCKYRSCLTLGPFSIWKSHWLTFNYLKYIDPAL